MFIPAIFMAMTWYFLQFMYAQFKKNQIIIYTMWFQRYLEQYDMWRKLFSSEIIFDING